MFRYTYILWFFKLPLIAFIYTCLWIFYHDQKFDFTTNVFYFVRCEGMRNSFMESQYFLFRTLKHSMCACVIVKSDKNIRYLCRCCIIPSIYTENMIAVWYKIGGKLVFGSKNIEIYPV